MREGKGEFLRRAAQIEGVYVPSLYEVQYKEDGLSSGSPPAKAPPPPCASGSSGR
ncbi:hypothetical protein [Bittarella massiliensis (ex Durand et al. 2017)]|uniref:Uncharacterized protein n=1 Tax=Bittarella massiliensis (ex Durand et al. 2017) TaxID=1720313 RepID=A0AAW5KFU8_9FIRM|nr:hypothetical protein [Bittarella massiliensis (ex Durand et al. 2017)]MCQ4950865.1 hypothetical protein [Bittarella massiliensis (ex Durand et al. 2017)]